MAPALQDGQQVLAVLPRSSELLKRGSIVVLQHPVWRNFIYIKRIIGLPGEHIRLEGSRVYLDDILLEEPYLHGMSGPQIQKLPTRRSARLWITEEDEVFVLGDQRSDSQDSRAFGPVHRIFILGRVWLRYWPPQAWGLLTHR